MDGGQQGIDGVHRREAFAVRHKCIELAFAGFDHGIFAQGLRQQRLDRQRGCQPVSRLGQIMPLVREFGERCEGTRASGGGELPAEQVPQNSLGALKIARRGLRTQHRGMQQFALGCLIRFVQSFA